MGEPLSGDGVPVRHRHAHHDGVLPDSQDQQDSIAVHVLLAATLRARNIAPEAEQRALSAFRASNHGPDVPRARTRRRDDWRPPAARHSRRSIRATFGAVLASLALGGVAVAAIHSAGGAGTNEATTSPSAPASPQPADAASSLPSGRSRPADSSTQTRTMRSYCRNYQQAQKHDATPDETALRHLSTAAGGRNRVAAYCAEQLTGERSAPNKPAGPDQPGEHTEGRKHSSGAHSDRPGNGSIGADAGDVQPTAGNSPENGSKEGSRNRP